MADHQQKQKPVPAALNLAANSRKTNPSPLQVSTIPTPVNDRFAIPSPREVETSASSSSYQHEKRSSSLLQSPKSPAFNSKSSGKDILLPADHGEDTRSNILATPRAALASPPNRAVSGPAHASSISETSNSPPDRLIPRKTRTDARTVERPVLRTASIDSTMSSNSSIISSQVSQDPLSPNPLEMQQLIASAGSAESLIRSLMREKQTAAQQNAQLWRLINKQRHLIMGLNSDLAKAAEDREKYQKRYQELSNAQKIAPAQYIQTLRGSSISMNASPARSEEDLPIQRHSVLSPPKVEHRRSASVGSEARTTLKELRQAAFTAESVISSSTNTSPSFSSEGKPRATPDSEASEEGLNSRRDIVMMSDYKPISPIAPLQIKKLVPTLPNIHIPSNPPSTPPPIPGQQEGGISATSFAARRSMTAGKLASNSPVSAASDGDAVASPLRKGPPARLNLQQKPEPPQIRHPAKSPRENPHAEHSESEYDVDDERPTFERGRKKTRAEDDREREYIIAKEEESRSKSKQEKRPKSVSTAAIPPTTPDPAVLTARSPAIHAFSPNGSPAMPNSFSPHASLDGMLSARSAGDQSLLFSAPPVSPGLPRSPRPGDRPQNAPLPRAPNENSVLSPPISLHASQAPTSATTPNFPKQVALSLMPQTSMSIPSPRLAKPDTTSVLNGPRSPSLKSPGLPPPQNVAPLESPVPRSPKTTQGSPKSPKESPKSPRKNSIPEAIKSPTNKGPPNNILQRMPSENSSLASISGGIYRGLVSEAYPDLLLPPNALPSILVKVTSSRLRPSRNSVLSMKSVEEEPVFTLGITARSHMKQLWRVEKPILSLPQLDHQLKQAQPLPVSLPDRNLFTGHAPSKIDARREALEKYFEDILDIPMNEKAAVILCQFLSAQAIPSEDHDSGMKSANSIEAGQHPVHLGPDGRIIKEGYLTKRGKNFGGWKARYFILDDPTLRYYESPGGSLLGQIRLTSAQIGRQSTQTSSGMNHSPSRAAEDNEKEFRHAFLILEPKKKDSTSMIKHVLCAENDVERDEWVEALLQYIGQPSPDNKPKTPRQILTFMKKDDNSGGSNSREDLNTLQGVSYENTVAGQPVRSGPPLETPQSPAVAALMHNIPISTGSGTRNISGPTAGAVIQDASAWGNKAPESPKSREKEKKRSIWGFGHKSETQTSSSVPMPPPRTMLPAGSKPIFGLPLAEAVELYPARGTEMNLPSVVYRCFEYLEAKAASSEEGIFRLSGSNVTIKALKDRFNQEGDVDFPTEGIYYDVHAVASLLKMYLRELPSSVLGPRELHRQFQAAVDLEDKASKIAAYNVLVHRLPPANWTLIRSLSAFLIGIVNNSNVNKMTVRNVGIVFSPTLNIPSPLFAAFLTNFDDIFTPEPPPSASALSPVMEDPDPEFKHHKHVLNDSRPPQSRDTSVQNRSRSRTRSRTPDKSGSSQGQHPQISRTSSEEMHSQTPDLHYLPPPVPQLQYQHQNSRKTSRERSQDVHPAERKRSEDGSTDGLLSPGETNVNKRESNGPGLAATNIMRDAKARRRESSMLTMGVMTGAGMGSGSGTGPGIGLGLGQQKKSSFPQLRNAAGPDQS